MNTMPYPKAVDIGQNQQLRSFKKGGTVPKTGVYKLHKNEQVIPAKKAIEMRKDRGAEALSGSAQVPKLKKKNKKPGMHIKPLDDGTFHITHDAQNEQEPMQPSKQFSARNAKHLVRHVRSTYGAGPEGSVQDPDIENPQGAA